MTVSPPVSPNVVAKTLMTQKPRVTAGTLVNACFVTSFIRFDLSVSGGDFADVSVHDYGNHTEETLRPAESYSLLLRSSRSDDPSTRSTWTSMTTRRGFGRGVR